MLQTILIIVTLAIAILGFSKPERGKRLLRIIAISALVICAIIQIILVRRGNREEAGLKQTVENIRDYAYVSKLNPSGKSFVAGFGLKHSTAISRIMEETLTEKDGILYFKCDDESLKRYQRTIQEHPRFPFSYVGMADCLRRTGDDKWREYAFKAISIFEITSKIDGHHKSHEDFMEQILRDLGH